MKGDFTRNTFAPLKGFTRVLMQQGRVQLDADWNEQASILLHYLRTLATDIIGPYGTWESDSFEIGVNGTSFDVKDGHYYVDGVRCQSDASFTYPGQLEEGKTHLVYLDAWERHITYIEDEDEGQPGIREVALNGADTATRAKVVWQVGVRELKASSDLSTLLGELWSLVDVLDTLQSDLEDARRRTDLSVPSKLTEFASALGPVTESGDNAGDEDLVGRIIPRINEIKNRLEHLEDLLKSLTRGLAEDDVRDQLQNIWHQLDELTGISSLNETFIGFGELETKLRQEIDALRGGLNVLLENGTDKNAVSIISKVNEIIAALDKVKAQNVLIVNTEGQIQGVEEEIAEKKKDIEDEILKVLKEHSKAKLRARALRDTEKSDDLCTIPPQAAYRGLENQLYRVEIHSVKEGETLEATFKWSRENGSVVFPISSRTGIKPQESADSDTSQASDTTTVTLERLGRDSRCGLAIGDWVEIVDDDYVLEGRSAPLWQVDAIDSTKNMVTLRRSRNDTADSAGSVSVGNDQSKHPLLRRWDHKRASDSDGAIKVSKDIWIKLENGIEISFDSDNTAYRTGDYWLIPARTATRDVEWPQDSEGDPRAVETHGIEHHYAPLAILVPPNEDETDFVAHDWRRIFSRLGMFLEENGV